MVDRSRLQSQLGRFDDRAPHIVNGDGAYVTFEDGRRLLDLNSGYWNVCLGYGHRSTRRAAANAFRSLSYAHLYRRSHEPASRLSASFAAIMPEGTCAKVLFSNDGTGAAEIALRIVLRWVQAELPAADTIIVLRSGYHGDSLIVRELGDYSIKDETHARLPKLRVRKVVPPETFGADVRARALEQIRRIANGSRLAAFFCEVVQGLGGIRPIQGDFLREVQTLCERSGALFVVDEIATGFGRTGRMFAFEHWGLRPDLTLVGKGVTNGFFPLAAVLAADRVSPILRKEFQHGHTTSGHPVGCVIAEHVIKEIKERRLAGRAQQLGSQSIASLCNALAPDVAVRGLGLFIGIDLRITSRASSVRAALEGRGILVGQEAGTLTLVPPLTISRADLDRGLQEIILAVQSALAT